MALVNPGHLVSQADLDPGASTDVLSRVLGVRDAASGTSILAATRGLPLQIALGARVLFDLTDAVVFGTSLPTSDARLRVALIAAGWGAISAFAATRAGERS